MTWYTKFARRSNHSRRCERISGLAAPAKLCGTGFDFRFAMGVPDYWIKLLKEVRDEAWHMGGLWYELTRSRDEERTISYVECHDQALVGIKR